SASAMSLVEPTSEKKRRSTASRSAGSAAASASARSCGSGSTLFGFDFEADVGGGRRLRQDAGDHGVGAHHREEADALEADAAGDLYAHPAGNPPNGL